MIVCHEPSYVHTAWARIGQHTLLDAACSLHPLECCHIVQVQLPSSKAESYTEESPVSKTDSRIKYGKYDLIKPWTMKPLRLHFENDKPFKQVRGPVILLY